MNKFIARSQSTKKILSIAQMASSLPVNVLISGDIGVGKTLLASEISHNAPIFEAKILEQAIINKTIKLNEYKDIIVKNLDLVLNKKEFIDSLNNNRIIATVKHISYEIESNFPIKIEIPPLKNREEDLKELIKRQPDNEEYLFYSEIIFTSKNDMKAFFDFIKSQVPEVESLKLKSRILNKMGEISYITFKKEALA